MEDSDLELFVHDSTIERIYFLDFISEGRTLAACVQCKDTAFYIFEWDVNSGEMKRRENIVLKNIGRLLKSDRIILPPCHKYFAAHVNQKTYVFDYNTLEQIFSTDSLPEYDAYSICFSPDGKKIAGNQSGRIFVLETKSGNYITEIAAASSPETEILFDIEGECIIRYN